MGGGGGGGGGENHVLQVASFLGSVRKRVLLSRKSLGTSLAPRSDINLGDEAPAPVRPDLYEVAEVSLGEVHMVRVQHDVLQVLLVVLPTAHPI